MTLLSTIQKAHLSVYAHCGYLSLHRTGVCSATVYSQGKRVFTQGQRRATAAGDWAVLIGDETVFELDPGHYLVRLRLPSGSVLSAEGVLAGGEKKTLTFVVEGSMRYPSGDPTYEFLFVPAGTAADEYTPYDELVELLEQLFAGSELVIWSIGERVRWTNFEYPVFRDWRFHYQKSWTKVEEPAPDALTESENPDHQWLPTYYLINSRTCWHAVVAPRRLLSRHSSFDPLVPIISWRGQRWEREGAPTPAPVAGIFADDSHKVMSLMAYLQSGDLSGVECALESIFDESDCLDPWSWDNADPYVVAAVGLALVRLNSTSRAITAAHWLAEKCPNFPDGKVLSAWLALVRGDIANALRLFIEVTTLGFPVFTAGFRLFLDGVALLGKDFPEWSHLRRFIVNDSVFTTFRGLSRGPLKLNAETFLRHSFPYAIRHSLGLEDILLDVEVFDALSDESSFRSVATEPGETLAALLRRVGADYIQNDKYFAASHSWYHATARLPWIVKNRVALFDIPYEDVTVGEFLAAHGHSSDDRLLLERNVPHSGGAALDSGSEFLRSLGEIAANPTAMRQLRDWIDARFGKDASGAVVVAVLEVLIACETWTVHNLMTRLVCTEKHAESLLTLGGYEFDFSARVYRRGPRTAEMIALLLTTMS